MNKEEAIRLMVERDFESVPTEWVRIVAEHHGEYHNFPMWGTMFTVDDFVGKNLEKHTVIMEENEDEEMAGEMNIIGTAAYLYVIDGRYVVGVHGAGWNFYDGVWNNIYDLLGLKWHDEEKGQEATQSS